MSRRRVAITGIGIVSALGATREATWSALLDGGVRHAAGHGVRHGRLSQPGRRRGAGAPRSTRSLTPLERRRWSRSDRFGVVAAAEALDGCRACSTTRYRRHRDRRVSRRRHERSDSERGVSAHDGLPRASSTRGRPRRGITSRARRSTSSPAASASEGLRSCVVAACSSSTIAIGQAADAVRIRPARRRARGRHRRARAPDLQRLQCAAADGSGALPAVRSRPRRHEHRRRRRRSSCSRRWIGHGARRARSTASWPATASPARRTTRPRRSRTASRSRSVMLTALRDAGVNAGRRRSRQRARHRDAAERSRRGARVQERVRRSRGAGAGDVVQIDDRPLPRRGRRARGRSAGADGVARRHSADDPSRARPTRSARSTSSPTTAREQRVALRRLDVAGIRRERLPRW